jgi:hypothetical protein
MFRDFDKYISGKGSKTNCAEHEPLIAVSGSIIFLKRSRQFGIA